MTTYATFDPAKLGTGVTLSNGNLTATCAGVDFNALATIGLTTGKWYFEMTYNASNGIAGIGNSSTNLNTWLGADANSAGIDFAGHNYLPGPGSAPYITAFGAWLGVGIDMSTNTLTFYNASGLIGTYTPTGLIGTLYPGATMNACSVTANFGASAFSYTVPTGYNAGVYISSVDISSATTDGADVLSASINTSTIPPSPVLPDYNYSVGGGASSGNPIEYGDWRSINDLFRTDKLLQQSLQEEEEAISAILTALTEDLL